MVDCESHALQATSTQHQTLQAGPGRGSAPTRARAPTRAPSIRQTPCAGQGWPHSVEYILNEITRKRSGSAKLEEVSLGPACIATPLRAMTLRRTTLFYDFVCYSSEKPTCSERRRRYEARPNRVKPSPFFAGRGLLRGALGLRPRDIRYSQRQQGERAR